MAIWCASSLALAVLLTPVFASPFVAVPAGVLPMLLITIMLRMNGTGVQDENAEQKTASGKTSAEGTVAKNGKATSFVGLQSAFTFLFLGSAVGTVGEALTDMAVTLALRNHLREGRGDLAIANQSAVIISMLLAYWTETRPGGGGANQAGTFIVVWSVCQVFRSCCMDILRSGGISAITFFVLVFIGRYIGPLGKAAQDTALLKLLKSSPSDMGGSAQPRFGVPATLLWTIRNAVARLERPLCQLILLHAAALSIPQVAGLFTFIACVGVLAIVKGPEVSPPDTKKDQ